MIAYLDTSFLVPLYSTEINSTAASVAVAALSDLPFLTELTEVEVVNALHLRSFRKQDTEKQTRRALDAFDDDLGSGRFRLASLPDNVYRLTRQLISQYTPAIGLRTADILHVAAALELGADQFYSFDRQQRKLAQTMKLKLNPYV